MKRILFIMVVFLSFLALLVFSSAEAAGVNHTALNTANVDRWEIFTDMSVSRGHPGVAVVNGKIHVIGGYNPTYKSIYRQSQELYDPLTDSWYFIDPIEIARSDFVTINYSDKIYTFGGFNGFNIFNFNHVYDPKTGTWDTENETPLPTPVSGADGVVLNDKIYVIGGYTGTTETNQVQIYDPSNKSWDVGNPMHTARSQFVAVVLDGLIYVIGGKYKDVGDPFDVEIFDPADGTWREGTPLPDRRIFMAAAVRQGKIYVIGGRNLDDDYMKTMFVYDPLTEAWTTDDSMPTARGACRAAVVDDTIYVIGGESDVSESGTANEAYGSFPPLVFLPLVLR